METLKQVGVKRNTAIQIMALIVSPTVYVTLPSARHLYPAKAACRSLVDCKGRDVVVEARVPMHGQGDSRNL